MGDNAFATLRDIEPQYDSRGNMIFTSGRESAVFNVNHMGRTYALKCYYNTRADRAERSAFLRTHDTSGIIIHPDYYHGEMWTDKGIVDVALYPWEEGRTLDWHIRKALHDNNPRQLQRLLTTFVNLASKLLDEEWRHGDIKTENIIVRPDGKMILVDCDALYAPTLPSSGECGTPNWTHPSRKDNYNRHIDDYGVALMIVSLAALIADPTLFAGECAVAMPALGNKEHIEQLMAPNSSLTELHNTLYSETYIINNIKEQLECIAHKLQDCTKPLL